MKNILLASIFCLTTVYGIGQNVGYDEPNPASKISIKGNLSVGASYSTTAAPTSGAIIQGLVGIGTSSPLNQLDVYGGLAVGSYGGVSTAPSNGLIVSGNVGIGMASPTDKLQVNDGNIGIYNDNNTAGMLKFYEPSTSGSNYMAFKAQTMSANVTYTLPAADGTNGQFLSTNGSGTLSWASGSGGSIGTTYALTPVWNDPNTALGGTYAEVGEVTVTVNSGDKLMTNAFFSSETSNTYQVMRVTRSQTAGSGTVGTVVGYCAWSQHDGSRYSSMSLMNEESGLATGTWYYKLWTTSYTANTQNYEMLITKVQ